MSNVNLNAVAIAYAIARNQESSQALQDITKAYRKGIIDGDNGKGEVTEPWEDDTGDKPIDIVTDGETGAVEPAAIDITGNGGVWLTYVNPDDDTDRRHVKVYVDGYFEDGYDRNGNYWYWKGRVCADVYDSTGAIIHTAYEITNSGSRHYYVSSNSLYTTANIKLTIYKAGYEIPTASRYNKSTGETIIITYDRSTCSCDWQSYVSRYTYLSCGNIKPI